MSARFEIYGYSGNWRWRYRSSNYRIIASGESHKRLDDARHAVSIMQCAIFDDVVINPVPLKWIARKISLRKKSIVPTVNVPRSTRRARYRKEI